MLKALFSRQREVPIIYNRDSKLFRKYLRRREKLSRIEKEAKKKLEEARETRGGGRPEEKFGANEVGDDALVAPSVPEEAGGVKTLPGLSLEEQLLLSQQEPSTGQNAPSPSVVVVIDGKEKDGTNSYTRRQREDSFRGASPPLQGSFVSREGGGSRPPPLSPGQYRPTPRLENVYVYDGLLFRKARPNTGTGVPDLQSQSSIQKPLVRGGGHLAAAPAAPAAAAAADSDTLFRKHLGSTAAPVRKDKNIRFVSPELLLAPPRGEFPAPIEQDLRTTTSSTRNSILRPPDHLSPSAPTTPLSPPPPSPSTSPPPPASAQYAVGRPVLADSPPPPPGGVYYKPADPRLAPVGEVYYKPISATPKEAKEGEPRRPKALSGFSSPGRGALRDPIKPVLVDGPLASQPQLLFGFQPVRFVDDDLPPPPPPPPPSPVVVLNGAFRTVYQDSRNSFPSSRRVRFPSL